ncbi:ferredoxin [Oxalobacteraceae bacterium GrIS 2.11]
MKPTIFALILSICSVSAFAQTFSDSSTTSNLHATPTACSTVNGVQIDGSRGTARGIAPYNGGTWYASVAATQAAFAPHNGNAPMTSTSPGVCVTSCPANAIMTDALGSCSCDTGFTALNGACVASAPAVPVAPPTPACTPSTSAAAVSCSSLYGSGFGGNAIVTTTVSCPDNTSNQVIDPSKCSHVDPALGLPSYSAMAYANPSVANLPALSCGSQGQCWNAASTLTLYYSTTSGQWSVKIASQGLSSNSILAYGSNGAAAPLSGTWTQTPSASYEYMLGNPSPYSVNGVVISFPVMNDPLNVTMGSGTCSTNSPTGWIAMPANTSAIPIVSTYIPSAQLNNDINAWDCGWTITVREVGVPSSAVSSEIFFSQWNGSLKPFG